MGATDRDAESLGSPDPYRSISSRPSPLEVRNRKDLSKYLSQSLSTQYHVFEDENVRQTSTFIKSYIMEYPNGRAKLSEDPWSKSFSSIHQTDDPSLLLGFDKSNVPFFLDVRDERFSLLHTVGRTVDTDQTVKNITDGSLPGFDRAWFPSQFLLESHIGTLRGFKFSHEPIALGVKIVESLDRLVIPPIKLPIPELESSSEYAEQEQHLVQSAKPNEMRSQRSTMSVKDSATAMSDYQKIRNSDVFANRQSLDWIQYQASSEEGSSINHGLYSNGKIVANGTSIALHLLAVENLKSSYGRVIQMSVRLGG